MTPAPVLLQTPARLLDFMREADQPGLINLAAGVPGWDALPQRTLSEATKAAADEEGPALYAYHHPEGDPALRGHIAAQLTTRNAPAQASQIITVTGCTQALQIMLSVLVRPGDVVACEAPAYYGLLELLHAAGARVLSLPVRDESGIDPAEVEPLLAEWQPRCLVVCSTLSNPSGATLSVERRQALVEVCRRHGVPLIDDDIYGELLDGGPLPPLRAWDPEGRVVSYVSSFCKSVSPGLRVGVCWPAPHLHEAAAERKCQQDLHGSVLSEVVLRKFLEAGSFAPHMAWLRERNQRRRALAHEAVKKSFPAGCRAWEPAGGYMLWVELPAGLDLVSVRAQAKAQGIVFGFGRAFFTTEPERPYMRLNCAKASEEELVHGITTLGALLHHAA